MKDFKKMPKMADGGSVDTETKKYVKPARPDLSGDSRGLLSRLKESKEKPQKTLGPVDMTGSMGNIGGKPETGNYRRPASGGSAGGGDMSGMKGLDKPYKRGGRIKKMNEGGRTPVEMPSRVGSSKPRTMIVDGKETLRNPPVEMPNLRQGNKGSSPTVMETKPSTKSRGNLELLKKGGKAKK